MSSDPYDSVLRWGGAILFLGTSLRLVVANFRFPWPQNSNGWSTPSSLNICGLCEPGTHHSSQCQAEVHTCLGHHVSSAGFLHCPLQTIMCARLSTQATMFAVGEEEATLPPQV